MLHKTYLTLAALGLAALAPLTSSTFSANPAAGRASRAYLHSYNLPGHGVAIDGYSPVSYFRGKAERGSALFAVDHDGVTYHLTDADQVAEFKRAPDRYAPAFGGWCAFGMAVSDKFPVDPTAFEIVGGRLLLFLRNDKIDARKLWQDGDGTDLLAKAEAHWRKVQG